MPGPALVEKDWYVVRALKAISTIDAVPFRLVFGGGTALSRAYRLIQRMSEDIDLKIVSDKPITRPELRRLRDAVTRVLLETGFLFDPANPAHRESGNSSRYTLYRLPYAPIKEGRGGLHLRPEIRIEKAVWPLRRPAVALPVMSFVAEAFNRAPEVPAIPCVTIVETIAEKFVALTRRAGAEFADAGGPRDSTLVRHIYDLHMLRGHYEAAAVAALARTIMRAECRGLRSSIPGVSGEPDCRDAARRRRHDDRSPLRRTLRLVPAGYGVRGGTRFRDSNSHDCGVGAPIEP